MSRQRVCALEKCPDPVTSRVVYEDYFGVQEIYDVCQRHRSWRAAWKGRKWKARVEDEGRKP